MSGPGAILIAGPTASGKSALALRLVERGDRPGGVGEAAGRPQGAREEEDGAHRDHDALEQRRHRGAAHAAEHAAELSEIVRALETSDATLAAMDDWNTRTHGQSGLIARVRESAYDEAAAEAAQANVDTEFGRLRHGPLPGTLLAEAIESGTVRALVVVAGNPLLSIAGEERLRKAYEQLELVVVIALVSALVIGVPLGMVSGYLGGWLDRLLVLLMDTLYTLPVLLLSVVLAFLLGKGLVWKLDRRRH